MFMEMTDDQEARFVRRLALRVSEGKSEDFASAVRNEVLPRTKSFHGLRRMYLLRSDSSPAEYIILSFWNNKADADSYQSSDTFVANSDTLRAFLESDPVLSQYHIEVHYVNSDELPPPKVSLEQIKESKPKKSDSRRSSSKKKKTKER